MHSKSNGALWEQSAEFGRNSIAKGSLSFNLASKLLPRTSRDAIRMLYAWCRYADDVVDKSGDHTLEMKQQAVTMLEEKTKAALRGDPTADPIFVGLSYVARRFNIPQVYFMQLLKGMSSDLYHEHVVDEQQMRLYCYRVAGVIGLMFCHIVGINDERALAHAVDLGSAMQMTNISRDILEDDRMGRVYIPATWLDAVNLSTSDIARTESLAQVCRLARRLVETADELYRSGTKGLDYLPFRTAIAVATASRIYQAIGHKVIAKGPRAWRRRTWISLPQKLVCALGGFFQVLSSIPRRMRTPFSPVVISQTYRRYSTHES